MNHSTGMLVASAAARFKGCSQEELRMWRYVGGAFCSLVATLYYVVPIITLFLLPAWVVFSRASSASLIFLCMWITLARIPVIVDYRISFSKLYASVALYFDAQVWCEQPLEEIRAHPKPLLWLAFPHGVISFGGWSVGSMLEVRPGYTASADVLLMMPILRHLLGVFGFVSGSRHSLKAQLQKTDVWLYPGGLAELFLSSPDREELYFNCRKGCIRLALESGSDIIVLYLFGNTKMWKLLMSKSFAKLSRALRSSVTVFWGRWGLPYPYQTQVIATATKIIKMPDFSTRLDELTQEVIDREHARVKEEILRIFEANKHRHPGYANKKLTIY